VPILSHEEISRSLRAGKFWEIQNSIMKTLNRLPLSLVLVVTPLIVLLSAFLARRIFLLLDEKFADVVSGAVLTSMVPVYNFLRKREIKFSLYGEAHGAEGLGKLSLKWHLAILYGTIVTAGIIQVYAGLMGLIIGYLSPPSLLSTALDLLGVTFGVLVLPLIYYFLGTWVGKRSNKHKPVVLIAIVLLERTLNIIMTYLILPDSMFVAIYGMTKAEIFRNPVLWVFYGVIICLGVIAGLVGTWRGHRARMSGFMEEVFKVLPTAIQKDIVALSFDEAQRALPADHSKDTSQPTDAKFGI
jgi:hypothetical protein